jgi:hypothetical protein
MACPMGGDGRTLDVRESALATESGGEAGFGYP